ncbi:DUF3224 domain-containing protein [Oleiagrimonas sp. C23AA]|uniref:DUF3224 domain-containing protein n=1 Tax=Oleiagrimonas sp. C23AA TaxID=2719047 RepID=UPI0019807E42|nr:DUF3224 domain-containing protein [Oleiagrimonas sp. C23AA]
MQALGHFDLRLDPQAAGAVAHAPFSRVLLLKRFHGDLVARSRGELLTFRTPVQGSSGFVALEQVDGLLGGREGSFVLRHSGTLVRGASQVAVSVLPDSGTGSLVGLHGDMHIGIEHGLHAYRFEYAFREAA